MTRFEDVSLPVPFPSSRLIRVVARLEKNPGYPKNCATSCNLDFEGVYLR